MNWIITDDPRITRRIKAAFTKSRGDTGLPKRYTIVNQRNFRTTHGFSYFDHHEMELHDNETGHNYLVDEVVTERYAKFITHLNVYVEE